MEPLGEGSIDQCGWRLPEDWGFVCAANPPRPGYDVDELDEALMDRMLHVPLGFDVVRWIAWAETTDIPEDVVGFTARFPELMAEAQTDLTHLKSTRPHARWSTWPVSTSRGWTPVCCRSSPRV